MATASVQTPKAPAHEGASVMIADIDADLGRDAERKLKQAGVEAEFVQTDIASESFMAAMARRARQGFGRRPRRRWR